MNAFGDPADYDVRIIRGRKTELEENSHEA